MYENTLPLGYADIERTCGRLIDLTSKCQTLMTGDYVGGAVGFGCWPVIDHYYKEIASGGGRLKQYTMVKPIKAPQSQIVQKAYGLFIIFITR